MSRLTARIRCDQHDRAYRGLAVPGGLKADLPGQLLVAVIQRSAERADTTNNLLEFIPDNVGGRLWNAYDLTEASNGPQVAGDPAVFRYSTLAPSGTSTLPW